MKRVWNGGGGEIGEGFGLSLKSRRSSIASKRLDKAKGQPFSLCV